VVVITRMCLGKTAEGHERKQSYYYSSHQFFLTPTLDG
jgi:hypothetical protein